MLKESFSLSHEGILKRFFAFIEESLTGPFEEEDIVRCINDGDFNEMTYLYDLIDYHWKHLCQFPEFQGQFPSLRPPKDRFIIYREEKAEGPYSLKQLQELVTESPHLLACWYWHTDGNITGTLKDHPSFSELIPKAPEEYPELDANKEVDESTGPHNIEHIFNDQKSGPTYVRRYERVGYSAMGSFECDGVIYKGMCNSIGQGGCFLELRPEKLSEGSLGLFTLFPGPVPIEIQVESRVASIRKRGTKGIGLQFLDLNEKLKSDIQKFVDQYNQRIRRKS